MAIRTITVARDDSIYECFPCLTITPSGTLFTVYRESDSHTAQDWTDIVVRRSTDGGESWSDKHVLVQSRISDGVLQKWNCARIGVLPDGRMWIICDHYPLPPGERQNHVSEVFFWWSDDEGQSWDGPHGSPIRGIVPDKLVVTHAGTWLVATHYQEPGSTHLKQVVYRSTDGGAHWEGPLTICDVEGLNTCEAGIVQLDDGLLVCYMRENSGLGLPAFKCLSDDDGRTWQGPYETNISGCHRPVVGLTPSGKVLVTHRHTMRGIEGSRKMFWAWLEGQESARETDPFKQGGLPRCLDYDRSNPPDGGYSGWVNLPGGGFFCVNYICDGRENTHIRGYYFSEADF